MTYAATSARHCFQCPYTASSPTIAAAIIANASLSALLDAMRGMIIHKECNYMLLHSQERLGNHLDNAVVPFAAQGENESPEIFEQRQERFNSGKYKAAMLVRQNVVEIVEAQLNVQWTAYQMMEHLTATYGDTTAVNFAVKLEEVHNFTIAEDDDPTNVIAKI
ncbi:hypothetical protein SeMB42_g00582 [Synchytrium endobioticum]|uniref:Uncharacterized protein n=1 Tax=Synchytrium endobioticum TaxID=286115 RepID=A0A507DQ61_9FUNG|nr:hypothetical protein SeLEV6574_g03899 [Synchytrium endobioticum]TPX53879.1 hypothetical protein SeMB42_g00582 [Synchytrium endobioticum]